MKKKSKTKEARTAISAWKGITLAKDSLFPSIITTGTENYTKGVFPGKKKIPLKNLKVSSESGGRGKCPENMKRFRETRKCTAKFKFTQGCRRKEHEKKNIILYDVRYYTRSIASCKQRCLELSPPALRKGLERTYLSLYIGMSYFPHRKSP